MRIQILSVLSVFCFLISIQCWALTTLKTTMSSGFYQDRESENHSTVFFNFKHHYLHKSGVESFFELGVNNNFIQDSWGAYPHQFYINLPLDNGFANAPYYKSRIIFGRQLLTEGFELDILDGLVVPYYFSKKFGMTFFGGGLHVTEDKSVSFDNQIGGALFFLRNPSTVYKFGPIVKSSEGIEKYLGLGSFMASFDNWMFNPSVIAKTQFELDNLSHDQTLVDTQFFYKNYQARFGFSSRRPDNLLLPERNFIYELIAVSNQETIGGAIVWDNGSNFSCSFDGDMVSFDSKSGANSGEIQKLTLSWYGHKNRVNSYFIRTKSFGGTLLQLGGEYKYSFDPTKDFVVELDVADADKINNISGKFYNGHLGMNFNFWERWRALFSVEAESNHLFEFNLKAVAYVTHFYY